MHIIHQGFDGFDITVATNISSKLARELEIAKDQAAKSNSPKLVTINSLKYHVADHGLRGGYAYSLDSGLLGYKLWVKKPNPNDIYGIGVSFAALPLAIYGLEHCYNKILEDLSVIGCKVTPMEVLVRRIDYAIDLKIENFFLEPMFFVHHSRIKRDQNTEIRETSCAGRVIYCRVGKIPNKQITIYDKRKDILDKNKPEWWKIWNTNLEKQNLPKITKENSKDMIWRFELRLGKEALRKFNIKLVEDFFERGGSAFINLADTVRYTAPTGLDKKRNRWPDSPEWIFIRQKLSHGLKEMAGSLDEQSILKIKRDAHQKMLLSQIAGTGLSYLNSINKLPDDAAQLCPRKLSEILSAELSSHYQENRLRLPKKVQEIRDKQNFLVD